MISKSILIFVTNHVFYEGILNQQILFWLRKHLNPLVPGVLQKVTHA